jgi:hypothetical protein
MGHAKHRSPLQNVVRGFAEALRPHHSPRETRPYYPSPEELPPSIAASVVSLAPVSGRRLVGPVEVRYVEHETAANSNVRGMGVSTRPFTEPAPEDPSVFAQSSGEDVPVQLAHSLVHPRAHYDHSTRRVRSQDGTFARGVREASGSTSLTEALTSVQRNRMSGVFSVGADEFSCKIHVFAGTLVFAQEMSAASTFGQMLVRKGILTNGQYFWALQRMDDAHFENEDLRFAEVLVSMRCLSLEGLHAALSDHVKDIIVSALLEEDAPWSFESKPYDLAKPQFPLAVEDAVAMAVKRFTPERLVRVLDLAEERFVVLSETVEAVAAHFRLGAAETRFLHSIDGTRTTQSLLQNAPRGFDAYAVLATLVLAGAIELVSCPESAVMAKAERHG